jgi:VPDSG-CTERM motif
MPRVSLDAVASAGVPDTGSTVGLLSLAVGGLTLFAKKRRTEAEA